METLLLAVLLLVLAARAEAQPTFWSFDNDRARVELNAPNSGTLPGTCVVGSLYVQTGVGLFFCSAANTWTASGTGITGGVAGRVAYWSGVSSLSQNPGFVVDSATQKLTLGDGATANGTLSLRGATSGTVSLQAAPAAGSITFKLPVADGSNGHCLVTNGAGQLAFSSICTGSGSGIASLNGLGASTQTVTNDANVGWLSAGSNHAFTWTGQLSVARGGTSLSNFIGAGSILYATSTTALASSPVLANHGVVLGGGNADPPHTITPGAVGLFLQSQGPGADPIWSPGGGGGGSACAGGGTVTINDPNFSANVAFASPLPNALYAVVTQPRPGTGTPPLPTVFITNVTASGFSLNLTNVPGPGNSIIVSWIVTPSTCTF